MARLSLLDSSFVLFESAARPLHVSGLLIMEPPQEERDNFAGRLHASMLSETQVQPPFNKTVQLSLTGLPKWKYVKEVDLGYHVRLHHLPKPGNQQQLMELVGTLQGQLMDRSRPLWEFHIIDGLEGGQVAAVAKIHHAIGDGNKLTKITKRFLSLDPNEMRVEPFWQMAPESSKKSRREKQLVERALGLSSKLLGQVATLPGMARLSAKSVMKLLKLQDSGMPVPFTAPKTPFNFTQRQGRTVDGIDFPMATLKRLSRLTGASINDIALTLCDMALNQYLKDQQWQLNKPLIALMPVNLKNGQSKEDNLFSPALIELGGKDAAPSERLAAIMASSQDVKSEALRFSPEAYLNYSVATSLFNLLQGTFKLNGILPAASNLIISNVPGPKETRYLMGAKIKAIYPFGVLTPAQTLNITLFSYDGRMHFGFNACRRTLPGLEKLVAYHEEALKLLEKDVLAKAISAVNLELENISEVAEPTEVLPMPAVVNQ